MENSQDLLVVSCRPRKEQMCWVRSDSEDWRDRGASLKAAETMTSKSPSPSVLCRPLMVYMRPTCAGDGHVFNQLDQFTVNFIQKHLQRHTENNPLSIRHLWSHQVVVQTISGVFWVSHLCTASLL